MNQVYSSSSTSSNEEPLESYSDYKARNIANIKKRQTEVLNHLKNSSLQPWDKKLLLLELKYQVEKEMLSL